VRAFISFTAVDKPKAIEIAEKLRGDDLEVFVGAGGESLPPGGPYHDRIKAEIAACDVFIFLVSPTSVEQGRYTHDELGWVRARWPNPKNHVLPVMVASTPFAAIPPYLTQAVTVLEAPGNQPTAVLEAVRGMISELERERLELERKRI